VVPLPDGKHCSLGSFAPGLSSTAASTAAASLAALALIRLRGNNEYQSHIDGGVTCWASREIVAFPLVKSVRNHALAKSEALKKVVGTRRLSQRIGRVSSCVGGGLCGPLT
jgi:hypothetical protein